MAGKDFTPLLGKALADFHGYLSQVYEEVMKQDDRNKASISHLTNVLASLQKMKTQRLASLPSIEKRLEEHDPILAEISASDKILQKSQKMKQKFQDPTHKSETIGFGNLAAHKSELPCNSPLNAGLGIQKGKLHLSHDTIPTKKQPNRKNSISKKHYGKKKADPSKYSVISESGFHLLTEAISMASKTSLEEKQDIEQSSSAPSGKSFQRLLEENHKLRAKVGRCLRNEDGATASLFMEKVESCLCRDCARFQPKVDSKKYTIGGNWNSFLDAAPKGILYDDLSEVNLMCSLLSEIKFLEFRILVHRLMKDKLLPVHGKLGNETGIPNSLYQSFVDLTI